jgi:hypothetical protein
LRNLELTAPYFHNGGQRTIRQVVEFYDRGGDFRERNVQNIDFEIGKLSGIPAMTSAPTQLTDRVSLRRHDERSMLSIAALLAFGPTLACSGRTVNRAVIAAVAPTYPPTALTMKVDGEVIVSIRVDEAGHVVDASAVSGNVLL